MSAVDSTAATTVAALPDSAASNEALATPDGQKAHLEAVMKASEAHRAKQTPADAGEEQETQLEEGEKPALEAKPKPKQPEKAADASPGALAKARRLFQEGKVDEFSQLVFGKPFEDVELQGSGWKAIRNVLRDERAQSEERIRAAETQVQQVQQYARQLVPMAEAKAAFERRDFGVAIKQAFGVTPEEFQRLLIAQAHGQESLPPAAQAEIASTRREIAQLRAEREQERQQLIQQQTAQRQAQAVADHRAKISSELAAHVDPALAKLSQRDFFIEKVYEIQGKHWSARTKTTIPILEAAELAYEQIYGEPTAATPPGRAGNRGPTQRQATEATHPAPRDRGEGGRYRPTTLRHSQAAEAAPADDDVNAPWDDVEKQQERQKRIEAKLFKLPLNGMS